MRFFPTLRLLTALLVISLPELQAAEILSNGGFENGLKNWRPLWLREAGTGTATLDSQTAHGGRNSIRLDLASPKDFSFEYATAFPVESGDRFELTAWIKNASTSSTDLVLGVETIDATGKVHSWSHGGIHNTPGNDWQQLRTRFMVPPGIVKIIPRFIGYGPATVWIDDVSLSPIGSGNALRSAKLPSTLTLSNSLITLAFDTRAATFSVTDSRTGETYRQHPVDDAFVCAASSSDNRIQIKLASGVASEMLDVTIQLDANAPEFTLEVAGDSALSNRLKFPAPMITAPGDALILAVNEGVIYPVDDTSLSEHHFIFYGGHSYSMPFWGVTHANGGHMVIAETPNDAAIDVRRFDGNLAVAPEWVSQRGQLGYARHLRYIFFDQGGYVAMAKRYRAYSQKTGLFKTLAQKRDENSNVDRLIGAVNVWFMDGNPVPMAKEMQAAGIDRILWSSGTSADNVRQLNDLGLLTSRYDLYQDIMNPENYPKLQYKHNDWIPEAWPRDLITRADGKLDTGWSVEAKDGTMIPCGVLCDKLAPDYARKRIHDELTKSPYRCRFIDTTTAAPWRECYNPDHPMTRTESRQWKMDLLRVVSEENKLVTGTETGHDAAVPYVHYFEGMLSLTTCRLPDAGRHMDKIWDEVPDNLRRFQVSPVYRLPLWELVYHDCVVAHWYWGDYNNKLPAVWDQRDLLNILYATPPMFLFKRDYWTAHKERFVQSYRNVCPLVRSVGYSEMTDHRILTPDRLVQQSLFATGTTVTVNFSDKPYNLADGRTIAPMNFLVQKTAP